MQIQSPFHFFSGGSSLSERLKSLPVFFSPPEIAEKEPQVLQVVGYTVIPPSFSSFSHLMMLQKWMLFLCWKRPSNMPCLPFSLPSLHGPLASVAASEKKEIERQRNKVEGGPARPGLPARATIYCRLERFISSYNSRISEPGFQKKSNVLTDMNVFQPSIFHMYCFGNRVLVDTKA